jgi:hypothetical protein
MANDTPLTRIAEGTKDLYDVAAGYLFDAADGKLSTEQALESAISGYRNFASVKKNIDVLQAAAKNVVNDIMRETGQVKAVTPAGTALFTADSERVTWDSDALDALCASSAELARILLPHRTVKTVVGSLTIK